MTTAAIAAGSYAAAFQRLATVSPPAGAAPPASSTSFASLVNDAIASVSETGKRADAQATAVAHGKADLVDVVTAVADSEAAITTLVGVRDRVIAAYQQIMAMPI